MAVFTLVQNFHPCATLRADIYYDLLNPDGNFSVFADDTLLDSLTDLSGNGNNQSSSGSNRPTYKVAGINNRPALQFVASNSNYMSAATNSSNEYAGAVTVGAVFKSIPVGAQRLLTKLLTWSMSFNALNYMFTTWNSGGSGVSASGSGNPIVNNTTQVNIQMWDGSSSVDFYKNGTLLQTLALVNTTVVTTEPLYLGVRDGATQFFDGYFSKIFMCKRVLNSWEIYMTNLYLKIAAGV